MTNANTRVEVRLLGGVSLTVGTQTVTEFPIRKAAELVAYLCCRSKTSHPRMDIADVLWPSVDTDSGRNRLKQALCTSLKLLRPLERALERKIIIAQREEIRAVREAVSLDVDAFDGSVKSAVQAIDMTRKIELLIIAERLYRGPFMAGFQSDWVWLERQRLEEDYLQVLCDLSKLHRDMGELATAREYACRAVQTDPLSEECRRELMAAQLAMNARSSAVKNYRHFERLLREQLDQAPEPETLAMLSKQNILAETRFTVSNSNYSAQRNGTSG